MTYSASPLVRTAPCAHCGHDVKVYLHTNENDPGDNGFVRQCGHGDFVRF